MLRVFSEGLSSSGVKYFIGDITILIMYLVITPSVVFYCMGCGQLFMAHLVVNELVGKQVHKAVIFSLF